MRLKVLGGAGLLALSCLVTAACGNSAPSTSHAASASSSLASSSLASTTPAPGAVASAGSSIAAAASSTSGSLPEPKQADPCKVLTPAVVATLSPSLARIKPDDRDAGFPVSCSYATSDEDVVELNYESGPLSQGSVTIAECLANDKSANASAIAAGTGVTAANFPALGSSSSLLVNPFQDDLAQEDVNWTQADGCFDLNVELEAPIATGTFQQAALSVARALGT